MTRFKRFRRKPAESRRKKIFAVALHGDPAKQSLGALFTTSSPVSEDPGLHSASAASGFTSSSSTPRPNPSTVPINGTAPITALRGGPEHGLSVMSVDLGFGKYQAWLWSLSSNGTLSRREIESQTQWKIFESPKFLTTPVIATADTSGSMLHVAFAIEASTGHLMYSIYKRSLQEGTWVGMWEDEQGWRSLGGRFVYQPTVSVSVSSAIDVYVVNEGGELWRTSLAGLVPSPIWDEWVVIGSGFTGEVSVDNAVAYNSLRPIHVAALKDGQYQYASSFHGSYHRPQKWESLGVPRTCLGKELGYPNIMATGVDLAEVLVVCNGQVWQKMYNGSWSEEWVSIDERSGLEHVTHGHSLSSGSLFSRIADGCIAQIDRELTKESGWDWSSWWISMCPNQRQRMTREEASSSSMAIHDVHGNRFDMFYDEVDGSLWYSTWYGSAKQGKRPNRKIISSPL
ncbi:hypothetical protein TruAng_004214 [Truncatella angustata]|nr:hypothetical protein TruAng_004214 [Truncatella angustata]